MAFSKMRQPKRKRRIYATRESPFPVPIATITKEAASPDQWFYYTGDLQGDCVVVRHSGDMDFLYKMGFFGKGSMSRSKPEFNQRYRMADVPEPSGGTVTTRVQSRRSYIRRLNWKLIESPNSAAEYVEYDSAQELPEEEVEGKDRISGTEAGIDTSDHIQTPPKIEEDTQDWPDQNEEDLVTDHFLDSRIEESKVSNVDLWENTEADEDFWSCETLQDQKSEKVFEESSASSKRLDVAKHCDSETESKEWSSSLKCLDIEEQNDFKESQMSTESLSVRVSNKETVIDDMPRGGCVSVKRKEITETEEGSRISYKKSRNMENYDFHQKDHQSEIPSSSKIPGLDTGKDDRECVDKSAESHSNDPERSEVSPESLCDKVTDRQNSANGGEEQQGIDNVEPQQEGEETEPQGVEEDCDSLCCSDEDDGDMFVIDDSDSEPERKRKWRDRKWKPVIKKDPFYIREYLHLSLEETFFLAYGLGCLLVHSEGKELLNLSTMWRIFRQRQENFLPKYIVYHYFRSKGWVPKSGLKFGADYIIYKEGPPFYHGSYSVIVKMVDEGTLKEDPSVNAREFTWTSLAGLNRVTEHVAKEVMICYVLRPTHITEDDFQSPKCIPEFQVKEVVVSRWVSSQERESKPIEDMP